MHRRDFLKTLIVAPLLAGIPRPKSEFVEWFSYAEFVYTNHNMRFYNISLVKDPIDPLCRVVPVLEDGKQIGELVRTELKFDGVSAARIEGTMHITDADARARILQRLQNGSAVGVSCNGPNITAV